MDRSSVITLIAQTRQKDSHGVDRVSGETARTVFCNVKSSRSDDFHEGFRNGLNPQFVFTLFRYDYENESIVEYGGQRYSVFRHFIKGTDLIELHVQRKGGTNGNQSHH